MAMTTEERLGRLEGAYEHLATKEDLANLKADMLGRMNQQTLSLAGLLILGFGVVAALLKF